MSDIGRDCSDVRGLIEQWYRAGLDEVAPAAAVRRAMEWSGARLRVADQEIELDPAARVVAVAVGKAAAGMARGLAAELGERIDEGVILTRDGHAYAPPAGWAVFEARHPVPDERGVEATRHILDLVTSLTARDVAIVLISGGGSALLETPKPTLDLEMIQEVTRLLLRAGAPIHDLNAVRSELSEVKGGGLRAAIGEAVCVSLILSDVLGNDPSVIASGPTIVREPRPDAALVVLERYGLTGQVPAPVLTLLQAGRRDEPVAAGTNDVYTIVGDNLAFLERIRSAAEADGFRPEIVLPGAEGEARALADHFLDMAASVNDAIDVVIGGGEATVTVRGTGEGGRNTEFALEAAIRLADGMDSWVVASLASDGQDGTLDAAGAIVDASTVSRGRANGLDASAALADNDTGTFLGKTGDLHSPGPTGTNVNDVYLAVRCRPEG